MISRQLKALLAIGAVILIPSLARAGSTATDTWGSVPKYIAIMPGTSISVWKDANRALITGGAVAMTPVGDGTYEYIVGLTSGQTYNYLFYANSDSTAKGGLQAWNEYYDIVPASGRIRCSIDTLTRGAIYNDTTSAYYSSVAYDARRVITVPTNLRAGETIWVYNNFGETPGIPAGFYAAAEGDTQIRLTWTSTYGNWGQGGESFKAADVLAGGKYEIYRGNAAAGPFTLVATIDGMNTTYLDNDGGSGLVPSTVYHYCIRAKDAYNGSIAANDTFYQIRGDSTAVDSASTQGAVRTFFIVRDADWPVIESTGGTAWMSIPEDPAWGEKIPVRMVRVYLPPPRTRLDDRRP